MRTFYILAIFFTVSCLQACNIINPKEATPTYVHVDSFQFTNSNPAKYGSPSHNITCVWVYYNDNPVGVFDLPTTFPVLTTGNTGKLLLVPGITIDGLSAYQTQYPFYTGDTSTLTTNPGKITGYTPKTGYNTSATVGYIWDFETSNDFQNITGDSSIIRVTDPALVGTGNGVASGYIHLVSPDTNSENITQKKVPFTIGADYIEISYKNSMPFYVGVEVFDASGNIVTSSPEYVIGLNPSTTWKKMYVSLITQASKYLSLFPGSQFRLAIKAELPGGQADGYVLLDNIKYITN